MNYYSVKQYHASEKTLEVSVPASKSILNRALVLAALAPNPVFLRCGSFAQDTKSLLNCLNALGVKCVYSENGIQVNGCGGNFPNQHAELDVMSAGTTARFLTTALAFCGGEYTFRSSAQMQARPMEHLKLLEEAGVRFTFFNQPYHFPFQMQSNGITCDAFCVNTDESTQYASGILLAASTHVQPLKLILTGNRTSGSYIRMTVDMMKAFGIPVTQNGNELCVQRAREGITEYFVEPDLSAACYFYAISLLFSTKVLVNGVSQKTLQGDSAFLKLLEQRGVVFQQTEKGLLADGTNVNRFEGFCQDVNDFSDQTLTLAALAPFATTPSILKNVEHIRAQECDRIYAICKNLENLGANAYEENGNIYIQPSRLNGATIETFADHRVAMAFALIGLKIGNVRIENPECCKKTFENYFELLEKITKES